MEIKHSLPELPYNQNSLNPILSEETFSYHYGIHHATYVANFKKLIQDTSFEQKSIIEIIKKSYLEQNTILFNNVAQHWNHTFFWYSISPDGGKTPQGKIKELINKDFGNFENFKNQFSDMAIKLFGSGWIWLVQNEQEILEIITTKDANTPIVGNQKPILTLDVWEHAYYIDYRNARTKFVEGYWEIINWNFANENLK